MIDSNVTDRLAAKEIMIAYIAALGERATNLFPRKESGTYEQGFPETWETILKTVSDHH
jgi:hypothetical protein